MTNKPVGYYNAGEISKMISNRVNKSSSAISSNISNQNNVTSTTMKIIHMGTSAPADTSGNTVWIDTN